MCKIIRSEPIIGNFLLAAVESGKTQVEIKELYAFKDLLNSSLNVQNYFAPLNYMNILDFADDYPFFVKSVSESDVHLNDSDGYDILLYRLNRYFRMGLPGIVAAEMQTASKRVLEG